MFCASCDRLEGFLARISKQDKIIRIGGVVFSLEFLTIEPAKNTPIAFGVTA